ncbi:MAG: cell division protein ZapA [Bacteroides sp.]|nr:cell division protein ZapA [Bacteroides sp.]MDE5828427.1 cell division protein ZapA [Duncaniella sp.]
MKDKLNITIRIANLPPMRILISPDEEEVVRKAQKNVNLLWERWSERFTENTPGEVLGMVAYRFAQMFYTAEARMNELETTINDLEKALDNVLLESGSES